MEKAIADTKDAYYDALAASDAGWHEGKNDPKPFVEYMLGVILSCYRDLALVEKRNTCERILFSRNSVTRYANRKGSPTGLPSF